jgi:hypothetical protein
MKGLTDSIATTLCSVVAKKKLVLKDFPFVHQNLFAIDVVGSSWFILPIVRREPYQFARFNSSSRLGRFMWRLTTNRDCAFCILMRLQAVHHQT